MCDGNREEFGVAQPNDLQHSERKGHRVRTSQVFTSQQNSLLLLLQVLASMLRQNPNTALPKHSVDNEQVTNLGVELIFGRKGGLSPTLYVTGR